MRFLGVLEKCVYPSKLRAREFDCVKQLVRGSLCGYLKKIVLSFLRGDTIFSKGSLDGYKFQHDLNSLSFATQCAKFFRRTGQML